MVQCSLGHPPSWTCSACPTASERAPPAPAHFNARGELIPYVIIPEAHGVALVPEEDALMKGVPGSPETDLDDDMGMDLELAYPDDEPESAPAPPPPESSSPTPVASSPAPAVYTPPTPDPSRSPSNELPARRAPLPRRTVRPAAPRASLGSSSLNAAPKPKPKPKPTTFKVSAPRSVPAPAPGPIALPQLPMSVPASVYAVPHVAGMIPPRAMPMPMPMPVPLPPPQMMPVYTTHPLPPPAPAPIGCSTAGCKGTVPAAGRRCLTCVRGSWAGRKEAVAEKERTPKAQRVVIKLKVTPKPAKTAAEAPPVDKGKGKAVEDVPLEVKPTVSEDPVGKVEVSVDKVVPEDKSVPVDKALPVNDAVPVDKTVPVDKADATDKLDTTDKLDEKGKSNVNGGPPESSTKEEDDAGIWAGGGWDSEMSDLTDLTDSDGGESEVEEVPRPSFKIRIPARTPNPSPTKPSPPPVSALPTPPASISRTPEAPRLCTIARCRVPLPPHSLYRWKCCSACRKQYREYQRGRLSRIAAGNAAATSDTVTFVANTGTAAASTATGAAKATPATPKATVTATVGAPSQAAASTLPNALPPPPPPAPKSSPYYLPPRELRTPAEVEAVRARAAQKEAQREENRRALALRTPAELEAIRAHAAQKEWQREENRRALERAGAPIPGPSRARRPATDPVTTWNVAPTVQLQQKQKQVKGARVCVGRGCEHIIPSDEEYAFLMCAPCRVREQRKVERLLVKEGKAPASAVVQDEFPVAEVRKPGRCMYADCGYLIPPNKEMSAPECTQCVRRKAQRKPPGRPLGSRNKPKPGAVTNGDAKSQPKSTCSEKPVEATRKRKRISSYPAYQSRDALLKDFGDRFHNFIEAQQYYYLMRGNGAASEPPAQAMFDFSGEYAIVAADFDVVARKDEVELGVHSVKDAVARAGGLEFSPTSWVSILGKPGGVVTRFACVHLVNVFLPKRVLPGHPPHPPHTKSMQGELEIAVLPDDSHKYFPGEKTIVRFRLVG